MYLNRQPNARKRLLVPCALEKPNPKCYVCAEKPEVSLWESDAGYQKLDGCSSEFSASWVVDKDGKSLASMTLFN